MEADIKIIINKKGEPEKILFNGLEIQAQNVGVDTYCNPGEKPRVVLTYEPESFAFLKNYPEEEK